MIIIEKVSQCFMTPGGTIEVLDGVDGMIQPGEFLVIAGCSGEGKSTLLHILGGLLKPSQGKIWVEGRDIYSLDDRSRAKLRAEQFGFIFQNPSLLPALNILDNILLPVALTGRRVGSQDRERALKLLQQTGLKEKASLFPAQLSGGQQRRAGLARALMLEPPYIFADEPTADLDKETEQHMLGLLSELNKAGTTIILVTHAAGQLALATRALELKGKTLHPRGSAGVPPTGSAAEG
ncbi:ABC transporter ATP-binding protein [Sporomusa acidovorans]|uniref:ABC transporter ATP-binding protein YknY n=1 Tax=Sporomusa acidovorans (strain ATCC 49682 / DSM 3132 / Mol) TaxID=1123286 RepID=A0ABZ3JA21_SPOA4|nr:ABC transporter ATP-binding protein [Sporomusa acidovorans]OZC21785.1 lipoprotein-releasing system ATP-binding protein LolD [Sporomusa acidovorans DSM 3132]SDD56920.1 putative ABC transport system ATP-binding protein [Sporomusa acidovorans]